MKDGNIFWIILLIIWIPIIIMEYHMFVNECAYEVLCKHNNDSSIPTTTDCKPINTTYAICRYIGDTK